MKKNELDAITKDTILHTSWGYDMTINNYCKVLENTGKTLKCVMIGADVKDDNGMGGGRSTPDILREYGEPFRIRISKYGDDSFSLVGSYPFCADCGTHNNDSKRKGYWGLWDGKADYYNTFD